MYRNLNTTIGGLRPLQTPLVGVPGSSVPSTGEGGRPAWLYPTVQSMGWGSDLVSVWVESATLPGLFVNDDTSWTWTGLTNGAHVATARVGRFGVDQGAITLTLIVGAGLTGSATLNEVTASGAFGSAGSSGLTGAANLEGVTSVGSMASVSIGSLTGAASLEPVTAAGEFSPNLGDVPVAAPGESVSPIVDVSASTWRPVGSGTLASAIGEDSADQADYMERAAEISGEAIVALAELLPPGQHVISMMASASAGVGRIRLRLLDADQQPVGDSGWQAVFGQNVVYKLPVQASAQALYVAIDGGRLFGASTQFTQTDVRVAWLRVQALGAYDGQNVPDA